MIVARVRLTCKHYMVFMRAFPFRVIFSCVMRQEDELHENPPLAYVRRIALILVPDQHLEVTYVSNLPNFVELAIASVNIISPL